MFFESLKRADNSAKENKTVITYKADGDGVKTVKKELINLARLYMDSYIVGLYAEPIRAYSGDIDGVVIWRDFEPCVKISTIYNETTADKVRNALQCYNTGIPDYTAYAEAVKNTSKNGGFIGNDILYLLQLKGDTGLFKTLYGQKQGQKQAREKTEREEVQRRAEEERKQAEAEAEERKHRHAEKMGFLMGYGDGKTQIQAERIYNILSVENAYRMGEKVVYKSRRDFILDILAEGGNVEKYDNMVYFYGSKWDRKQGTKTVYHAVTADGLGYEITKTEYDFGKFIEGKEE